ncbi:MAG: peptidoglycan recognition family protein [Pirellulales bacterium]
MLIFTAVLGAKLLGLSAAADCRAPSDASATPSAAATSGQSADVLQTTAPVRPWKFIVLHHSATGTGDVASIDQAHRQQKDSQGRPWLGIGYHFVVGNGHAMGDGEVQATFRWREQLAGAHAGTREYNEHGIGICLIGNFEDHAPTTKQIDAARDLVRRLAERHAIPRERIVRHQEIQATACPGRQFPWEQVLLDVPPRAKGS